MSLLRQSAYLVHFGSSELLARLQSLGWAVELASPEWWLMAGREAADRVVVVDWSVEPPASLGHQLRRHAANLEQAEVWVTADPPNWLAPDETAFFPLLLDPNCSDGHWSWALAQAGLLAAAHTKAEKTAQRLSEWEQTVDLLPSGVFRAWAPSPGTYYLSAWSHRAQELTGWGAGQALSQGRGFSLTTLLRHWDGSTGALGHLETMEAAGRQRTLHFLVQASVDPVSQTWSCAGVIRDLSEDPGAQRNGERALSFLQEIKERLEQLELGDSPAQAREGGSDLTDRERDVYHLIRAGLSNAQIGMRLGCSESSVKKHVTAVFDKKGVHSRAQLMALS